MKYVVILEQVRVIELSIEAKNPKELYEKFTQRTEEWQRNLNDPNSVKRNRLEIVDIV